MSVVISRKLMHTVANRAQEIMGYIDMAILNTKEADAIVLLEKAKKQLHLLIDLLQGRVRDDKKKT